MDDILGQAAVQFVEAGCEARVDLPPRSGGPHPQADAVPTLPERVGERLHPHLPALDRQRAEQLARLQRLRPALRAGQLQGRDPDQQRYVREERVGREAATPWAGALTQRVEAR